MLVLLPFLTLLLLILICHTHGQLRRRAILSGAVLWGVLVTAITEVLSLFHALTTAWLAALWCVVFLGLAVRYRSHLTTLVIRRTPALSEPVLSPVEGVEGSNFERDSPLFRSKKEGQSPSRTLISHLNVERRTSNPAGDLPPSSALMLAGVSLIVAMTGLIAFLAPPNTWDSMSYHMSRVMHWIQNQSIDYYPSHTTRQLHRSPWAEYAILQFQLLGRSDRFANLVQWIAMLGSVTMLTLIAKLLGADARGQILTAVVATTLPTGILQASSTQTDYAASFWLICLVALILQTVSDPRVYSSTPSTAEMGATFGLAVLTKATNYLYVTPFLLWWIITGFRRRGVRFLSHMGVAATVFLVLNVGPYARNIELYGSPLGPGTDEPCGACGLTTETRSPGLLFSNLIRHVGRHLGTPFEPVNLAVEGAIYQLHIFFQIPANDPRVTWRHHLFSVTPTVYSEDLDGNPFHLVLLGLAIIGIVSAARAPAYRSLVIYAAAVIGGLLLLCAFIKWNPFVTRLHLPFFLLGAPLTAIVLLHARSVSVVVLSVILLFALAVPYLLFNDYRPLVVKQHHYERLPLYAGPIDKPSILKGTRSRLYFSNWPELAEQFHAAVMELKARHCFNVGLLKGWDDWEYPLWPLLAEVEAGKVGREVRIEHVAVTNQSSRLASREPFSTFAPCAVLKIDGQALTVVTSDK